MDCWSSWHFCKTLLMSFRVDLLPRGRQNLQGNDTGESMKAIERMGERKRREGTVANSNKQQRQWMRKQWYGTVAVVIRSSQQKHTRSRIDKIRSFTAFYEREYRDTVKLQYELREICWFSQICGHTEIRNKIPKQSVCCGSNINHTLSQFMCRYYCYLVSAK